MRLTAILPSVVWRRRGKLWPAERLYLFSECNDHGLAQDIFCVWFAGRYSFRVRAAATMRNPACDALCAGAVIGQLMNCVCIVYLRVILIHDFAATHDISDCEQWLAFRGNGSLLRSWGLGCTQCNGPVPLAI